ncbi:hypothetical protein GIB67_016369 [Kingdonia uniflora]|uniref:Uncharacterized protein n=1 Tax=Kingdonia uniflora TaxID=39325 RepID=A0A7J7M468_9MAGN|nr:hypothetical protein GIB67_016369 [Kingdonia uniflora]
MADESETQPSTTTTSTSATETNIKQSQVPTFSGFPAYPYGDMQMYPALIPGLIPFQNEEPSNHGAGIYGVSVIPFMGSMTSLTSNTLIPLTYNIPTRTSTPEGGAVGAGQEAQQQHAVQRQVIELLPSRVQLSVIRAENALGAPRLENGNAAAAPEGQHPRAENLNRIPIDNGDQAATNENHPAPPEVNLWIIVKEIRMIVVGFITSFTGFQNVD